jgi:hypothetical protein
MQTVVGIEDVVARFLALEAGTIAAIEGFSDSGKTTLADYLGKQLAISVFHLDSFARKFSRPPPYPECIDLAGLRGALDRREVSRPAIVEGICLRDVLALINVSPVVFVYLKRTGSNGLWYDGLHLEQFEAGEPVPGDMAEPHRSDLEYHARMRPHEIADLTCKRITDH